MPSAFTTSDAPRASDYTRCIRCGLCLNACPTFRVLGEELDSPRGRIYQIAQADAGRLPLSDGLRLHLDQCLVCRACETACPSGVPYGAIIERARADMRATRPLPRWQRWWQSWLLESLLPNPGRIAFAARLLRIYQRSGLQTLVRAAGVLHPLGLADAERFSPALDGPPFPHRGQTFPAHGTRRARVIFIPGCAQNALLPGLNHATVRVLRQHGCEVVVPNAFGCCGALHTHAGLRDFARQLARANIAALEDVAADAIISNASGCGAALKEYAELFDHGPEAPAWQERARRFSARVQDATEFLDALGLRRELLRPIAAVATYQDPCHLAHAQHVREAPRRLLAAIPGLELREMERSDQCCGSAGIYNLQQPAIARSLLADREMVIAATGASLIVTANPGCMLQLARAAGPGQAVRHVLEMLDRSAGENSPPERE